MHLLAIVSLWMFLMLPFKPAEKKPDITGTWKLISGITESGNDVVITDYTHGKSFIKVINATHFAFFLHDVEKGKGTTPLYGSGGGPYTLKGNQYTEYLEYCNDREWEGHDFTFTVTLRNDTLVQTGREKVESAGIDRVNTEKYVRMR
ncbi:MAG: hypothetical protein QM664_12810 [Flavihumibacter sp.]